MARSEIVRVLGIDPGTRFLGWGVVERRGRAFVALGHGVLAPHAKAPLATRLARIAAGLREVVREYAPTEAAIEEAFHGRDARAALKLGEARGAALVVVAEAGVEATGYANNVVKRAVAGAGRATKEQVQAMVVRLLGLRTAPEALDASDALALAICHLLGRGDAGRGVDGPSARIREAIRRAERAVRTKPRDSLARRP